MVGVKVPPCLQLGSSCAFFFQDYQTKSVDWPIWISRVTNVSHFLLCFACSTNFFIYYAKHGQVFKRKCRKTTPNTEMVDFSDRRV